MPKLIHCYSDFGTGKFGAIELECKKSTSLYSSEMTVLAKHIALKVCDDQLKDQELLLIKNPQLKSKIIYAESLLNEKILISRIWVT